MQFNSNCTVHFFTSMGSISKSVLCFSSTETPSTSRIKITKKHTMLKIGDTEHLIVRFCPDREVNDLTWSSAAENIAKVDSNGKVTGTGI